MFLIYTNEQDGIDRAHQEGQYRNLPFWSNAGIAKTLTLPKQITDGDWALDVTDYELDDVEAAATVDSVTFPEPPEDDI